jgi:hypothetical protein
MICTTLASWYDSAYGLNTTEHVNREGSLEDAVLKKSQLKPEHLLTPLPPPHPPRRVGTGTTSCHISERKTDYKFIQTYGMVR